MSSPSAPEAPQYQIPDWAQGLPAETLDLIRQGYGQQVAAPQEYDIASQALQSLLNYQPSQYNYQLPMDEIKQALTAQQALDMESYQKQIRPVLAAQGQLDSSYYTNLLGDYTKGQQAQTYGTVADLLTQQANQDLAYQQAINQFMPQFQSGIAGQLTGLGGQRAALDQFNLMLPYQTTIPALQSQYGLGLNEGGQKYQADYNAYQQQVADYQAKQAQQQQLYSTIGGLGLAAATGGLSAGAGLYGSQVGAGGGALLGLQGITPTQYGLSQNLGSMSTGGLGGLTGNYRLNPSQSQTLGFNTRKYSY